MKRLQALLLSLPLCFLVYGQKVDTVIIDGSKINTKVLIPGMHRWLVYFRNGKDSSRKTYALWSREIAHTRFRGKDAITVTQEWEDNDSVLHKTYSVNDEKTFSPLYQESWWRGRGTTVTDFIEKKVSVNGAVLNDSDTSSRTKRILLAFNQALNQFVLNWHLDLEVFPLLPFKENRAFVINFYDPALPFNPSKETYTVIGSDKLKGYDNSEINCWLLYNSPDPGRKETFWISKKTGEVLKLEQEFGGRYRYKIKLGFSK